MSKSQFNIKISKDLLTRVKRQAIKSGKSLTEHITDLVQKSLSENEFNNDDENYLFQVSSLQKRLTVLESIVSNREYLSKKLKPFNNSEAINCTNFMRGAFELELKKRKSKDKKKAFDDFLAHTNSYTQLNKLFTDRLEEVMLSENPIPWTGKELNKISGFNKCNCPIRNGLIQWIGITNCPSQQEICDKGEKLLSTL